jgi:hypothetical protein
MAGNEGAPLAHSQITTAFPVQANSGNLGDPGLQSLSGKYWRHTWLPRLDRISPRPQICLTSSTGGQVRGWGPTTADVIIWLLLIQPGDLHAPNNMLEFGSLGSGVAGESQLQQSCPQVILQEQSYWILIDTVLKIFSCGGFFKFSRRKSN